MSSNDELAGDQLAGDLALAGARFDPTTHAGRATVEIVDRDWTLQDHVEHDLAQVGGMAQLNDEPLSATLHRGLGRSGGCSGCLG